MNGQDVLFTFKINIDSKELDIDVSKIQAHKLLCLHAIFLHVQAHILGKLDQGIYGRTSLITKSEQNTQAGMHACYGLACTGPYLSQMGWDQRVYGIRRTCRTSLST